MPGEQPAVGENQNLKYSFIHYICIDPHG